MIDQVVEFIIEGKSSSKQLGRVVNQENILYEFREGVFVITGYLIEGVNDKRLHHIPYFNIIKLFEPVSTEQQSEIFPPSSSSSVLEVMTEKKRRGRKKKEEEEEDWQMPDQVDDLPF